MQRDFILLDRSGSMTAQWHEALGSINGYVKTLVSTNIDTRVTVVCFDKIGNDTSFDILRQDVAPASWQDLTVQDAIPRGGTPLNDAIVKIVALAEKDIVEKAAIIIMTDGGENASPREVTREIAKAHLQRCRDRGWQVVFLGANYDTVQEAATYGTNLGQTVNSTSANLRATMTVMASKRGVYGSGTAATMSFSAEEQAEASRDK